MSATSLLQIFFLNDTQIPGRIYWFAIFILIVVFLKFVFSPLLNLFYEVRLSIEQYLQSVRDKKLKKDKRPLVVYLRDFDLDGLNRDERELDIRAINKFNLGSNKLKTNVIEFNLEKEFAQQFSQIGPFIALADNRKSDFDQIGATRRHVAHEIWKNEIELYFKTCAIIFFRLTTLKSEGLAWEFIQVMTKYRPKTIFYIDLIKTPYQKLLSIFQQFNVNLPGYDDLRENKFVCFNKQNIATCERFVWQTEVYISVVEAQADKNFT